MFHKEVRDSVPVSGAAFMRGFNPELKAPL